MLLDSESTGPESNSLRDARPLAITQEQYQAFLDRHAQQSSLIPEDNDTMKDSYLLLDEKMWQVYAYFERQHDNDGAPVSWTVVMAARNRVDQFWTSALRRHFLIQDSTKVILGASGNFQMDETVSIRLAGVVIESAVSCSFTSIDLWWSKSHAHAPRMINGSITSQARRCSERTAQTCGLICCCNT